MIARRLTTAGRRVALAVALASIALVADGCGRARPYRAMAKAASSEENVFAQAEDRGLKMCVREELLATDSSAGLDVTPYLYMGRVFLVGFAPDRDHGDALAGRIRAIDGVRSVDAYLPIRPANRSTADDLAIKAAVKSALALEPGQVVTRIEIEALAGHVVLLGVVRSPEAVDSAGAIAAHSPGVAGVTNFLLVPDAAYESLRPRIR